MNGREWHMISCGGLGAYAVKLLDVYTLICPLDYRAYMEYIKVCYTNDGCG